MARGQNGPKWPRPKWFQMAWGRYGPKWPGPKWSQMAQGQNGLGPKWLPAQMEGHMVNYHRKSIWGPTLGRGGNLSPDFRVPGEDVSWRNGFPIMWNGGPPRGDGFWGRGKPFGQAQSSQTHPGKMGSQGFPIFPSFLPGPTGPPVVIPIGPLWEFENFCPTPLSDLTT